MKGVTVLFEGIDGAGKSYALDYLKQYYDSINKRVVVVPSISLTDFKNTFDRKWYDITNVANRYAQYVSYEVNNYYKNILPNVIDGSVVLIDRYLPSCFAYNELPNDSYSSFLVSLMNLACKEFFIPDVTFLFDVSNDVLMSRFNMFRQHEDVPDLMFAQRVRDKYSKFISTFGNPVGKWNIHRINGDQPINNIVKFMATVVEGVNYDTTSV